MTQNARQIGSENQHLKLVMSDESNAQLDVIGFGFGKDLVAFENDRLSIVGQLSINEWNGNKNRSSCWMILQWKGFSYLIIVRKEAVKVSLWAVKH